MVVRKNTSIDLRLPSAAHRLGSDIPTLQTYASKHLYTLEPTSCPCPVIREQMLVPFWSQRPVPGIRDLVLAPFWSQRPVPKYVS